MKKTISINISGVVFHIEEDGYDKLRAYLTSIQQYFSSYDDSQEIVTDIENRIAEKLLAKLKSNDSQVVTLENVTELIGAMGTVADFEAVEDEEILVGTNRPVRPVADTSGTRPADSGSGAANTDGAASVAEAPRRLVRDLRRKSLGGVASGLAHYFNTDPVWIRLLIVLFVVGVPSFSASASGQHGSENAGERLAGLVVLAYIACWIALPGSKEIEDDKSVKKFFRDPADKVLGGVASGLAAYFGVEVGLVRLVFVLTIPLVGIGLIAYLALWSIAPPAKSLTERMEMQGQPITLTNIEHSIKTSLNMPDSAPENSLTRLVLFPFRVVAHVFAGLGRVFGPVLGGAGAVVRVFAGIMVLIVAFSLIIAVFAVFGAMFGLLAGTSFGPEGVSSPYWVEVVRGESNWLLMLSGLAFAGITALWVLLLGLWLLTKRAIVSTRTATTLVGVQLLALLVLVGNGSLLAASFRRDGSVEETRTFTPTGTPTFELHDADTNYDDAPSLRLEGYDGTAILLEQRFEAQGRNVDDARANARRITYQVSQQDSTVRFDNAIDLKPNSRFRAQRLELTLKIPYDRPFRMTKAFSQFVGYRFGDDGDGGGLTDTERDRGLLALWTFTRAEGLVCLNFPRDRSEDTDNEEGINENEAASDTDDEQSVGDNTRQFDVTTFAAIDVNGAFAVRVKPGDDCRVVADGDQNQLDRVRVQVKDGTLQVTMPDGSRISDDDEDRIGLTVTLPILNRLRLTGASSGSVRDFKNLDKLTLDLTGACSSQLTGDVKSLLVNLTGASSATLDGRADQLTAELTGASKLTATDMSIDRATVSASGASEAVLGRVSSLSSRTAGASRINRKE